MKTLPPVKRENFADLANVFLSLFPLSDSHPLSVSPCRERPGPGSAGWEPLHQLSLDCGTVRVCMRRISDPLPWTFSNLVPRADSLLEEDSVRG